MESVLANNHCCVKRGPHPPDWFWKFDECLVPRIVLKPKQVLRVDAAEDKLVVDRELASRVDIKGCAIGGSDGVLAYYAEVVCGRVVVEYGDNPTDGAMEELVGVLDSEHVVTVSKGYI